MSKRRKITTNQIQLNSAIFQSLLFGDLVQNYDEALKFAIQCDYNLDNSCLYGAEKQNENRCVLEAWTSLNRFISTQYSLNDKTMQALFDILLKTNAHCALNIPNLFLAAQKFNYVSEVTFQCLLTRPDLFDVGYVLYTIASWKSTNMNNIFMKCLQISTTHVNAYEVLNQLHDKNILILIVNSNLMECLQKLLECVPVLEIDWFSGFQWISIEEINLQRSSKIEFRAMLRCVREMVEMYRGDRATYVIEFLNSLSKDICNIINDFGKRPIIL
jgi:hypothetical protein